MTGAPDGSYLPLLAAEVPTQQNGGVSADGLTVTWKLRPGVVWSDGQPFGSKDVVFTYKVYTNTANPIPFRVGYSEIASVIPLVTVLALDVPTLFSGAVVTESIFAWPGMGRLFLEAAFRFDYPVRMGVVTITAVLVIAASIAADVVYAWLDPRIRYT